ncbi:MULTISPECIES: peroxiredoxin [Dermacoccus]|jgi:peroxiredoxin|uniref:Alkyl hydroperoxide reductase E n=3 Tax=Dermacoccus TaxID=57495 RepID=A0A417Z8U4_9MICO|nr:MULTISPECIES: peroxiredoxin [Dermacoccus]KLO62783.1 peroxiredoxin [Dermacoccus sp. PE3]MBE7371179.1 peroxiredoxin [Dermacoccus barathri]MBZ4498056.1 peroxiredoxin [Dermacoccus sp. Tok2021]MCT1987579.1 peroxiredoxin [Dermacoccus abyssi]QEH93482.1 peroxiredoxin [Dermacoccus abyssi]
MTTVTEGSKAPDFTLKNQFGEDVTLSQIVTERPTLIVFYPFAFSGICTGELCTIRDTMPSFDDASVRVVGISCDPMFTQRAWAEDQGYDFSLLSDFWPHGEVAKAYGVFDENAGFAIRGTFLVDADMTVRWSLVNGPGEARDFTGALEAL